MDVKNDAITTSDLDFYLTVITMFCAYNQSQHFSDKMFADITSDIIKRDAILEKLAEDGYITAKKSKNFPHRYAIDITPKGIGFQRDGGYKAKKGVDRKNKAQRFYGKITYEAAKSIIQLIVGAILGSIGTYITTNMSV